MDRRPSSSFWHSQTLGLASTYVAIIMAMSLMFSTIFYTGSVRQLEHQLPEATGYTDIDGTFGPSQRVQQYLELRVAESKEELFFYLVIINALILVFGSAISFVLARWSLRPIESAMESQTQFVSDASHELRTPLTAMITANEVTLRRKKLTLSQAKEAIDHNLSDARRLQNMTKLLLDLLADDTEIEAHPTPVSDIVEQALSVVGSKADQKHIKLVNKITDDMILADIDASAQVITIILDNAIKYSPDRSTVQISTRNLRGRRVAIGVHDEGPGIAKLDQEKVFARLFRGDASRTHDGLAGYGLGLSIARKLAKAQHGSLTLESSLGEGSTFSLVLPRAK